MPKSRIGQGIERIIHIGMNESEDETEKPQSLFSLETVKNGTYKALYILKRI